VNLAKFRFYAELNAFISPSYRYRSFTYHYPDDATLKHVIEALGVPHTEVELVVVDSKPANLSDRMQEGMYVSVFPHFHSFELNSHGEHVHPNMPNEKFIADAHLGMLAKYLRMLGFDVLYRNSYSDAEVATIASQEDRIVLTRDRDLLIRKDIVRGCYLHSTACNEQLCEVFSRYGLAAAVQPFTRCLACNGLLHPIDKKQVLDRIPKTSSEHYDDYFECDGCRRIYWEGSHVVRMRAKIAEILQRCSKKELDSS
jgi:uncharacterized protein with PIN domain